MKKISIKLFGIIPEHNKIIHKVIKMSANKYGLTPVQLFIHTNRQPICEARQYAMFILATRYRFSHPYIGKIFDMDQSVVSHSKKTIRNRIEMKQLLINHKRS